MTDDDARLVIEGDRAVILAVIGTLNVGAGVVDKLPTEKWNVEMTQEGMQEIATEIVRQFRDQVSREMVTGERVVMEVDNMEEIVSLEVEGWEE